MQIVAPPAGSGGTIVISGHSYTCGASDNVGMSDLDAQLAVLAGWRLVVARATPPTYIARGNSKLTAGAVTVSNPLVDPAVQIQLCCQVLGTVTTPKALAVANLIGGSFQIVSADATDTSVIGWMLY